MGSGAYICGMKLFMKQKTKVISRRNSCFLGCIFGFLALCGPQMLQISLAHLVVWWMLTHCNFIHSSSLTITFFLVAYLFTHFRKSLSTCDFRLWTALNTNYLPVLWLIRKYLFVIGNVRRRICCLNIGNEELTLTILQGKPFGLGGEEGWRRAERSQLGFKIRTAFRFPYWLSALVGLSHHIFWASLYYVT